ncbi:hypothetical protein BDA96_04G194300 [Sorghum bicolor]|uniref:Uncharacterized protein n=1 Tax=Sorghum bicolor TaxID=4558 RepID=A0A921R3R2_SORBI|nr:hypothetical protein BDA96_04G194300 [Sorghum bicolor]
MQDDSYLLLRFSMSSGCPTQSNVSCSPAPWKGKKPPRPVLRASAATDVGACVSFNYATVAPPSPDEGLGHMWRWHSTMNLHGTIGDRCCHLCSSTSTGVYHNKESLLASMKNGLVVEMSKGKEVLDKPVVDKRLNHQKGTMATYMLLLPGFQCVHPLFLPCIFCCFNMPSGSRSDGAKGKLLSPTLTYQQLGHRQGKH